MKDDARIAPIKMEFDLLFGSTGAGNRRRTTHQPPRSTRRLSTDSAQEIRAQTGEQSLTRRESEESANRGGFPENVDRSSSPSQKEEGMILERGRCYREASLLRSVPADCASTVTIPNSPPIGLNGPRGVAEIAAMTRMAFV